MTRFIDVDGMTDWLASEGVERTIAGMMDYLEEDYANWEGFTKIPRVANHSPLGVIELMPASNATEYGFKYVNGHPLNPARGFQTVVAFGVLANVDNGYPTFLAEMTVLTALRTAAASGMVARKLARPDSKVHAMIGSGSQSEFQALGMRAATGAEEIRCFDIDEKAMEKFEQNIAPLGFRVTKCSSAAEAVEGADIVTVCTADKATNTILHDADVRPGMHLNAIGGDCPGKTELDAAILKRAEVFVEFPEQTRIEGEIQQMPEDFPVREVWRVITGEDEGRRSAEEITLFDSVGFAINDFAGLRYVRDHVSETRFDQHINLLAEPEDPKNLFSLVPQPAPLPR